MILGVAPSAVASTLARYGVTSIGREPGMGGKNIYQRSDVERVAANRIGSGNWPRKRT